MIIKNSRSFVLYELLIFGFAIRTALANPTPNEQPTSSTITDAQSDDYQYNDDEESAGPGDQIKSTMTSTKATALPYFQENMTTVLLRSNHTELSLKCPAKNLGESNVILWYREDNLLTNGLQVLNTAYKVDKGNFNLIISNATESHQGNYYCEILPQKIRLRTVVKIATDGDNYHASNTIPPELPQAKEAATATESTGSLSDRLRSTSIYAAMTTIVLCAFRV